MEQAQKSAIKQLFINAKHTLAIAWKADPLTFVLTSLMTLLGAAAPLVFSYIYKLFLDQLIFAQSKLGYISAALLGLFALRYVLQAIDNLKGIYQYQYLDRVFRYRLENVLTLEMAKKLSLLDIAHFENPETQNLIRKTQESYTWRIPQFIQNVFFVSSSIATFIGAFIILIPFGWWIPTVMVAAVIPRFWLRNKYSKVSWSVFNHNIPESKELGYISDILEKPQTVKEIRIFQAREALIHKMEKLHSYLFESTKKPLARLISSLYVPLIIEFVVIALLVYYRLPTVVSGAITIGSFTFFVQMLDQIARSTKEMTGELGQLYEDNLYIGYYFDVLELPRLIKEKNHGYRFKEISPPSVEFRNVSFGYSNGPKIIHNVSFTISQGEHFAIVGQNGAGKSTLIKLLLRFYDPDSGEILINGKDLRELKLDNWYKFVGTLFQDFAKFSLTIKENIMLGNSGEYDEKKMIEAAKRAGADEFIKKLPHQYDQRLGTQFENGTDLSIGQWQKLALARAFYEEAPLLILDEPTSAIDAEAEAAIFEHIDKVYQNKTLVLISHRFSSVRSADKIIVLKEGKIIEEGNHEQLMKKGGNYAGMFLKQAEGYQEQTSVHNA